MNATKLGAWDEVGTPVYDALLAECPAAFRRRWNARTKPDRAEVKCSRCGRTGTRGYVIDGTAPDSFRCVVLAACDRRVRAAGLAGMR